MNTADASIAFRLEDENPHLYSLLPDEVKRLVEPWSGGRALPVASQIAPFDEPPFFKPPLHVRSVYRRLEHNHGRAVIAFKGSEVVLSSDLEPAIVAMTNGRTFLNKIEFFVQKEHKLPLAVHFSEALGEAKTAVALYEALWEAFHVMVPLPLPILVVKWHPDVVEGYRRALFPHLSETLRGLVDNLMRDLGASIYFFPNTPVRVLHWRDYPESRSMSMSDMKDTIRGWIDLAARMMVAGFFPCTLENQRQGCCLSDQNACVYGGFLDVDAVQAMKNVQDPGLFFGNTLMTVQMLASTIATFLGPAKDQAVFSPAVQMHCNLGPQLAGAVYLPAVWSELGQALNRARRAAGNKVDGRLDLFQMGDPLDLLMAMSQARVDARSPDQMSRHVSNRDEFT